MPVVSDSSVLVDYFNPRIKGDRRARLDHLVETLSKLRTKVLIPAPALTELLVHAGTAREPLYRTISTSSTFRIEPFDARAAMECALLLGEAWTRGDQKGVTHTKFKFDWQIVAIAASRNATAIYSDDKDIRLAAPRARIAVLTTDSLPIPSSELQRKLTFDEGKDGGNG